MALAFRRGGRFGLSMSVRRRPAVVIVFPDVVHAAPVPYVRPTHTTGTGGRPTPTAAHFMALPRRSDEATSPAAVRSPH